MALGGTPREETARLPGRALRARRPRRPARRRLRARPASERRRRAIAGCASGWPSSPTCRLARRADVLGPEHDDAARAAPTPAPTWPTRSSARMHARADRSRSSAACSTRSSRGRRARTPTPTTPGWSSWARRDFEKSVRVPADLAAEISARRRARPAGLAGGARRQRLLPLPRRARAPQSSSATATSPASTAPRTPTTCCSTTSSPASRPPSCGRCSPSCATRSSRSSPPPATPTSRATTASSPATSASSAQRAAVLELLDAVGYDPDHWRLDPSLHPFAQSLAPTDVRLTTNYDEHDFGVALYSVPARVRPRALRGAVDPRADPHDARRAGLARRARVPEPAVGEPRRPLAAVLPRRCCRSCARHFPGAVRRRSTPTALYRAVNTVQPSLIRIEADETTYNLHIILRFELELALIEGTLAVDDLPGRVERGDRSGCSASRSRATPRACSRTSTGAPG